MSFNRPGDTLQAALENYTALTNDRARFLYVIGILNGLSDGDQKLDGDIRMIAKGIRMKNEAV